MDVPERWRYCHYCRADTTDEDAEHAPDCPTVTRLFPVEERDVLCPGCKRTYIGMRCTSCRDEFKVGDTYTLQKFMDGDGTSMADAPGYNVVCMSCAALDPEIETV